MSKIDSRNQRLQAYTTTAEQIKAKIKDVAENKNVTIVEGTDTPLTVLTKIDNATVVTPSGTKSITSNGSNIDVSAYAKADVSVQPNLQNKSETISTNTTTTINCDNNYDGLGTVTITTLVPTHEGEPIEISTSTGMDAVLVAENVGKVYRYIGTTTADYINGDLYEVEASS